MSMYDNFRAPQYVDFLNLQSNETGEDASAFFNSALEMDSSLKLREFENSRASSVSEISESERTLTSTSFNGTSEVSETTLTPRASTSCNAPVSKIPTFGTTPVNAASCTTAQRDNTSTPTRSALNKSKGQSNTPTPTRSAFNKSKGQGIKLDMGPKKVLWDHGCEGGKDYREYSKSGQTQENREGPEKNSSTTGTCGSDNAYSMTVTVNVIPPTPGTPGCALGTSTPLIPSNHSTKLDKEQSSKQKRRSRSVGPQPTSPTNEEEMLMDALGMLKLSSSKSGRASMAQNLNQSISPQVMANIAPSKKSLTFEKQRAKRKLSPGATLIRDNCQPEKFVSLAEQIARIQKNTPTRFRTVPKLTNLKQAVQSKAAKSKHLQPKVPAATKKTDASGEKTESTSKSEPQAACKKTDEKGVKVARWAPPPKVEPYKFTECKGLPKTIFNFDKKENLLLRDRKTPLKRIVPTTKVQPFSFDKRDQELIRRKVERIRGVAASDSHHNKPAESRQRSKSHSGEMLAGKGQQVRHARIPVVLYKAPFEPQLSQHRPTVPVSPMLSTQRRAKEREEFEEHMRKKEEMRSAALHELQERRRQEEEREVKLLRKELVHRAHPMPQFHQKFKVKPSNAPLTDPHSPSFMHRPPLKPHHKSYGSEGSTEEDSMEC